MDLLPSLTWPRVCELQRQDKQFAGFGGTVRPVQYQYRPVEHPASVQTDVKKVETIEADLPPEKEKVQTAVDTPPQVEEALNRLEKKRAFQEEKGEGEPPKKRKKTKSSSRLF